ncbi:secretory phospholipase A2 receptor [Oryzias latipes]|uniref:secretory phospholipase A2 receptor n=1 Tax=Oryzias latipes TaxID=8090 RepID=UPI0005CBD27D|nr:secretory phospholipase A2 receptor [Oryzias latipes]
MDHQVIILIFAGALLSVSFAQTRQFYFVNTPLNWRDAQSVCRQNYADLATIEDTADVDAVIVALSSYTGKAWIGLHDDMVNSWRWSLSDSSFYGDGELSFRNWYPGEPNNLNGQQLCVRFYGSVNGLWDDDDCSEALPFVCYRGMVSGTPGYILINTPLNWTDAQKYCRQNYLDLASIRSIAENNIIEAVSGSEWVWIGLYRQKVWSDGSQSVFQYNIVVKQGSTGDQCVTVEKPGQWSNYDCSSQFSFICHKSVPLNVNNLTLLRRTETNVTLQWSKIINASYVLQFNGRERMISAPDGDGPVTFTVSSLSAGTTYTFNLYSVYGNTRSTGVQLTVTTAPQNAENFRASAQTETSITLEWSRMNTNVSFILQFNGTETNISAPEGGGPVSYTVTSLTARTEYTFTLFCVFEGIRSSGVTVTAFTVHNYVIGLDMGFKSFGAMTEAEVQRAIEEFLQTYGLSPNVLSIKVKPVQP